VWHITGTACRVLPCTLKKQLRYVNISIKPLCMLTNSWLNKYAVATAQSVYWPAYGLERCFNSRQGSGMLFFPKIVQTVSAFHPASYSIGTGEYPLPRGGGGWAAGSKVTGDMKLKTHHLHRVQSLGMNGAMSLLYASIINNVKLLNPTTRKPKLCHYQLKDETQTGWHEWASEVYVASKCKSPVSHIYFKRNSIGQTGRCISSDFRCFSICC
jgi:hypothetical protein